MREIKRKGNYNIVNNMVHLVKEKFIKCRMG